MYPFGVGLFVVGLRVGALEGDVVGAVVGGGMMQALL